MKVSLETVPESSVLSPGRIHERVFSLPFKIIKMGGFDR